MKKSKKKRFPSSNPQLINVLKSGCIITFPNNYSLVPNIEQNKLHLKYPIGWSYKDYSLDKEGLKSAIKDQKQLLISEQNTIKKM